MTEREKFGAIFIGILLAVLGVWIFELMEQQKKQNARLRALRNQIETGNGFEADFEHLKNDWQSIRKDLETASKKALPDVFQTS